VDQGGGEEPSYRDRDNKNNGKEREKNEINKGPIIEQKWEYKKPRTIALGNCQEEGGTSGRTGIKRVHGRENTDAFRGSITISRWPVKVGKAGGVNEGREPQGDVGRIRTRECEKGPQFFQNESFFKYTGRPAQGRKRKK